MDSISDVAGKRVFVTGAHGFIGRHLVRLLAESGADVVCPYRAEDPVLSGLPGRAIRVDLRATKTLVAAMKGTDTVIHLAARSGGIQFQDSSQAMILLDNQAISQSVFTAAQEVAVHRLFLSSSGVVYRADHRAPIPESGPLLTPADRPSGYAWSKLTDETAAGWWQQSGGGDVVIGRLSNVYGPGASFDPSRSTVIHALIQRAMKARPGGTLEVWGYGSAIRSFMFVEDAARAIVTVTEQGQAGEPYNIDSGEPISVARLAEQIRDLIDPSLRIAFDESKPAGAPYRVLDNTKLRALGFQPVVSLTEGLRKTIRNLSKTTDEGSL